MKEWWRDFFIPVTGEIMFSSRVDQSKIEVAEVIRQTKTAKNA
jgi:hypothetical protein